MRHLAWLLLVPLVVLNPGFAQDEVRKTPPNSNDVEVRFRDESVVRMTILQESLDVVTKYGKLTIPVKEIRRIDFGVHLADGLGKKIEAYIIDLGSKSFRDRENASKQLLALGPKAYAAVVEAARHKDPEINQRAQMLLKRLREQYTAEQLHVRENDLIQTTEFPVIGRVVSPTLRARTAYFGEPEIPLAQLRSIRWFMADGRTEVTLEAAKYGSGNGVWLDTGVDVNPESHLLIKASGEIDLQPANPGTLTCGPAGYAQGGVVAFNAGGFGAGGRGRVAARTFGGALLGRIGDNGPAFVVGERYQSKAGQAGRLHLQIAPNPFGGVPSGSFHVTVQAGDSLETP
jgi:hypothetical protein